jgi:Putative lumazine-binding
MLKMLLLCIFWTVMLFAPLRSQMVSPTPQNVGGAQALSDVDERTKQEIISVIQNLFTGMSASDTARIRLLFYDTSERMQTVARLAGTTSSVQYETVAGFLAAVGKPKAPNFTFEERILRYDIRRDGDFANVWCPYEVYVNGQFRHCGVDVFNLVRTGGVWKFLHVADTRRTEGCK